MSVEVQIEIGHKAWKNIKSTIEGYTHDWTVFVRGANGNEIKHIVEKVIFHLPESYQDSKRIREEPPFALSESTSQSISILINVFFCTESKLRKVNYIYDMQISDEEVNILWMRELTFPNPSKEFKEKLLLAGGQLVDLEKTQAMMTGGLVKCKVELDDEVKIQNDVAADNVTLSTTIQKCDNLQNKCSMSNEEVLRYRELLEENKNLKRTNSRLKEKFSRRQKDLAFAMEKFAYRQTLLAHNTVVLNELKEKAEDQQCEISVLKSALDILQTELFHIVNLLPENSKEEKRGTIRKNDDMNISADVGKEKETVTQPITFISSPTRDGSSTPQNSSLINAVVLNSSQRKPGVSINDSCGTSSGNCFLSQSKNEAQSWTNLQNLNNNQYLETLDCHRNVSSANTISFKSTNTYDVEKSIEANSVKADDSLNESEIIIIGAEKSVKGSSVKANTSLNKFDLRNNAVKIVEESSFNAFNYMSTEPCSTNKPQEQFGTLGKEHYASPIKKRNIKSSNSNCKEDCRKLPNVGDIVLSSLNPRNTKLNEKKRKQKKGGKIGERSTPEASTSVSSEPSTNETQEQFDTPLRKHNVASIKNAYQSEKLPINSICKEPPRDIDDTSAPNLISFMTEHCQKLQTELNRIKNSEFSKYREGTNSLFYKLKNIDTNPITEECCQQYLQSLIDYFTNPKTIDMATIIYVIVDYLYRDRVQHENLPTYILNENTCVSLPQSENCIISALYAIDNKSLPHLNGLVRNTLDIIHQVIVSKKKMAVNGLASLCRVFMEICRRNNDRWEPLFLCCELLRLGHPLAPYLINSLAAVWRDPFKLYDKFSVEGNMVLGAIMYGMKEKPLLMDNNVWRLTQRLKSTYFPDPFIIDHNQATEFLTAKIVSRCVESLFENLWMLASPLVIFASKETWDWKMQFKNGYILPNLRHFSSCLSEHAFGLFCNLYVDIFCFSHESLCEGILQYFANTSLHQGVKFVQDCAAIALLKYVGITNKQIPAPLRDWFLRNQNNPKLALIVDLYCKKVMESHDSFLLWDDIIIV